MIKYGEVVFVEAQINKCVANKNMVIYKILVVMNI